MESIRVIMLRNWHFDILNYYHWQIAWDLWQNSWVISEAKEWAFVLIIISFIPLWFTGWIALSLVSWCKFVMFILTLPWKIFKNLFYKPVKIVSTSAGITPIKRKKSYKEIRPRSIKPPSVGRMEMAEPAPMHIRPISMPNIPAPSPQAAMPPRRAPSPMMPPVVPVPTPTQASPKVFEHSLFQFDDSGDDFDFDIDAFDVAEKEVAPQRQDRNEGRPPREDRRQDRNESRPPREDRRQDRSEGRPPREDRRQDRNESRPPREDRRQDRNESRPPREDRRQDRNENRPPREDRRQDRNESRPPRDDKRQDKNESKAPREDKNLSNNNNKIANSSAQEAAPKPRNSNSCTDILKQKGYAIIARLNIQKTAIDFVGVADGKICLCLIDKEFGDWLADEEQFNNEDPLWFSESSHRISPIKKISTAKNHLSNYFNEKNMHYKIEAYVLIQDANIINAEDMIDIWEDMDIHVTRIGKGSPKEIRSFANALPNAEKSLPHNKVNNIEDILRKII